MSEIHRDVLHPSRSTFLAIFDSECDIVDVYTSNTVRDEVFRRCEVLDREFPSCAPHTLWEHDGGDWCQLKERIHSESGRLISSQPIRAK